MKTLRIIDRTVPKIVFDHDTLTNALFFSTPPIFTDTPFSSFSREPLARVKIGFCASLPLVPVSSITSLGKNILSFNGHSVRDTEAVKRLSPKLVSILLQSYLEGVKQWQEFLIENLEEYCKDNTYSQLKWSVVSGAGVQSVFSLPLTSEQQLWIDMNRMIDRDRQTEFILKIRESLLPWLNPQLFASQEKRKKNLRQNVDYEVQRRKMITGTFIDDDTDLDIIK